MLQPSTYPCHCLSLFMPMTFIMILSCMFFLISIFSIVAFSSHPTNTVSNDSLATELGIVRVGNFMKV